MRNLYKVLGIASTADANRIKSEFRRRAKAVHPDLNPGSAQAGEQFRELMQAYKVLRDARARDAYNDLLARRRRESRRRFAQSAGMMVATFLLTTITGHMVLGLHGTSLWDGWQVTVASRPSDDAAPGSAIAAVVDQSVVAGRAGETVVAITTPTDWLVPRTEAREGLLASPAATEPAEVGGVGAAPEPAMPAPGRYAAADPRPEAVKAPPSPGRNAEPDAPKAPKTGVTRRVPSGNERAEPAKQQVAGATRRQEGGWLWPSADEPYGLGASGLQ